MKNAIQFGAGNIGRGFIGAMLSQAGYHVIFADINEEILVRINQEKGYNVEILDSETETMRISNISAVDSRSSEFISALIDADLVTTAVGLRVLPVIARTIAAGIEERMKHGYHKFLNIIACENGIRATSILKEDIYRYLSDEAKAYSDKYIGYADCSVDRIVPPFRSGNPIDAGVEKYFEWNVEESSLKGGDLEIKGMNLVENLNAYIERKLFTLNTGHAVTAYLGKLYGYETVAESINDPAVSEVVRGAMQESGEGLIRKFGFDKKTHFEYIEKIIRRFSNPYIVDSVDRVGREPLRKLSPNDRLIKPMMTARHYGYNTDNLIKGIGAALLFNVPDDVQSVEMQEMIRDRGVESVLHEISGLTDESLCEKIVKEDNELKKLQK